MIGATAAETVTEFRRTLIIKGIRWILAIAALGYLRKLMPQLHAALPESDDGAVKLLFLCFGVVVVFLLLVGRDIFQVVSKPLSWALESFYFPRDRSAKPTVNYKLPEYYIEQERFEDAMNEYLKIIRYHPQEAKAYIGAFELAVTELHDDETAKQIYSKARRKLKNNPEELMWLEARWDRLANEWIINR